ncbi:hypothetical protein EBR21_08575 [bacterium]|nr:hypothetical protein [bacterium]
MVYAAAFLLPVLSVLWNPVAFASVEVAPQESKESLADTSPVSAIIRFTLLDSPYNLRHGYKSPSMAQSLDLARNWYGALHWGLGQVLDPNATGYKYWLYSAAYLVTDQLLSTFPLSPGWAHEEWHRAVMTHRNVPSYNTINDFKPFQDTYAVSGQADEDLVRMKKYYPKDHLRLSVAGDESEREFYLSLQKDRFFKGQNTVDWPTMLMLSLGSWSYIEGTASGEADQVTLDDEKEEGSNIKKRDFVGMDYLGWVRDLHRPDEPFEARGQHPSGVGIRRYTKKSDLTSEEQDYLVSQSRWHLLNFIDPQLFGFEHFSITSPTTGRELGLNASLAHYVTPFGTAIRLNVFMKTLSKQTPFGTQGLLFAWQQNSNRKKSYPQIDIEHRPVPVGDGTIGIGARAALWLQPKNLDFFALKPQPGALLGVRVVHDCQLGFQPWLELEGKTKGWVAGQVDLGQTYGMRAGIETRLK